MDSSKFRLDTPYPEVVITGPNLHDVRCLVYDYAGATSETTAIFLYIYQSYVTQETYPDISKMLHSIAITEMHHHAMLGSSIMKLHGEPIIGDLNGFWSGRYVGYERDPKKFLKLNIKAEECAIENYRKTIKNLENESLKTLIERIILDEEVHIKTFREMMSTLSSI